MESISIVMVKCADLTLSATGVADILSPERRKKIERLIELEGNINRDFKEIKQIYYENPLSSETIDKMIMLSHVSGIYLDETSNSQFIGKYYKYYESVENERKNTIQKVLTKK